MTQTKHTSETTMKIIRLLMTATLGISIILLLAMIVTATSTEAVIGTSDDYIKVVPETAQKKGGVYTQTAYIKFPEDRTVECSFESKNDFQKAKVERYTVQTLTRPVYTTTCEKVYDSKNDSYHDECTTTQTGLENYEIGAWVDITREFDGFSFDAKNSYVIPGFTIKAGTEEVIRWSYTSTSKSGKWDLYCWSGGLDKYDVPFWSMRLDPFWNETEYLYNATVNYTYIQGDIVDGEGLLYLAKDNCSDNNFTGVDGSTFNVSCYENLVETQLGGTDGSDLEFYRCDDNEILNWTFVNITGLANWSKYNNLTNNVTSDAVRVWGINQSSNTSNVCVSLNQTTVSSTNEDANEDLTGWWEFEPSIISSGQLRDLSGNGKTLSTANSPIYIQNSSCAHGSNYSIRGCYLNDNSNPSKRVYVNGAHELCNSTTCSFEFWVKSFKDTYMPIMGTYNGGSIVAGDLAIRPNLFGAGTLNILVGLSNGNEWSCTTNATTLLVADGWKHFILVFNNSDSSKWRVYVNGEEFDCSTAGTTTTGDGRLLSTDVPLYILGIDYASDTTHAMMDSIRIYNRTLSTDEIMSLYNQGSHEPQEYYNLTELTALEDTNLTLGIFDSEYNNISLNISENEDFYVWANYTFLENGSVINDSLGFCNFSALEIATEYRNVTGTNVSICTSGCDSANVTSVFTGLDTDLVIHDVYRFRLCKDTPSEVGTYTIANNCSGSYSFAYNTIASCANGYTNVSVSDANCSSGDVTLSLWTNQGSARPIILVDGFTVLDRTHNHSEDLYFNDTLQLWVSDDLYEYNDNGTQIINVSCYYNTSGVQNQTDYLNITVENLPPTVTIDGIWYWLLSDYIDFTDGISAKYPLESTLNISFTASDNTLDTVIVYLNYTSNGTLIHQQTTTAREFNYTQSNFSTAANFLSGVLGYTFQVWTNDTDGSVASASKTFSAENLPPTCAWTNASGQSFAFTPLVFNNSISDPENESLNVTYWLNSTYNTSSNDSTGFVFNGSQNTYNLTLGCSDSFFTSANDSILFTYLISCDVEVVGLCDGCRYADNEFTGVYLNCTNGATLAQCYYSINDFATETINCTSFNFTAERGKNTMNLTVRNDGVNSSLMVRFWAKDRDARITDYSVIWFSILAVIMFFVIGGIAGSKLFMVFGCLAGVFLGFEFFAFSMIIGTMIVFGMGVMALALAIKT